MKLLVGPLATAGAAWLRRHGVAEWAGPKSLPEKPRRAGLTQREEAELLTGLALATADGPGGLATGQQWKP